MSPENEVITLGNDRPSFNLSCGAVGNPLPTFVWFRNDHTINITNNIRIQQSPGLLSSESTLIIEQFEFRNRGSYHCMAKNIVNPTVNNSCDPDTMSVIFNGQIK